MTLGGTDELNLVFGVRGARDFFWKDKGRYKKEGSRITIPLYDIQ